MDSKKLTIPVELFIDLMESKNDFAKKRGYENWENLLDSKLYDYYSSGGTINERTGIDVLITDLMIEYSFKQISKLQK